MLHCKPQLLLRSSKPGPDSQSWNDLHWKITEIDHKYTSEKCTHNMKATPPFKDVINDIKTISHYRT